MVGEPKFIKYPSIGYLGEERFEPEGPVEIFEKIDGSNCQVRALQGRILPGSRSHYLTGREWDSPEKLGCLKRWMAHFKKWAMSNYSLGSLPENIVIFGEWTAEAIVKYEKGDTNRFFLIDVGVLDERGDLEKLMEYETAVNFCRENGLDDVQFLDMLCFDCFGDVDLEEVIKKSDIRKLAKGSMEGVVVKDYAGQQLTKYLSAPYSELRILQNVKKGQRGITVPRIGKGYLSLIESGVDEDCVGEADLIKEVRKNIVDELQEMPDEVELQRYVLNFLKLRQSTS